MFKLFWCFPTNESTWKASVRTGWGGGGELVLSRGGMIQTSDLPVPQSARPKGTTSTQKYNRNPWCFLHFKVEWWKVTRFKEGLTEWSMIGNKPSYRKWQVAFLPHEKQHHQRRSTMGLNLCVSQRWCQCSRSPSAGRRWEVFLCLPCSNGSQGGVPQIFIVYQSAQVKHAGLTKNPSPG